MSTANALARKVIGASKNDGPSVEAQALSAADLLFASKHTRPVIKVLKPRVASQLATSPPVNIAAPVVSGTGTVGQVLTITNAGTWVGGGSRAYVWQRDGVNIAGATSVTYTLVAADSTHTVRAGVVQSNQFGSATAYSNGVPVT